MNQEEVLEGLITFLLEYNVELVIINGQLKLQRYNSNRELVLHMDLEDWIFGE